MYFVSFHLHGTLKTGILGTNLTLEETKVQGDKITPPAQLDGKWWSQNSEPGSLAPEPTPIALVAYCYLKITMAATICVVLAFTVCLPDDLYGQEPIT